MQDERDDVAHGLRLAAIAVVSALAVASTVIALGQPLLERTTPARVSLPTAS